MRINYQQFPYIDNYKNVRYVTKPFIEHMKECEDKIQKFAYNFDSCQVCYIYLGMFIVCDFTSEDSLVQKAHIQCFHKHEKGYDFVFYRGNWEGKLSEQEITLLFLTAAFTFFIECADVETVYLNKKSGKVLQNTHYANDTNKNIKIFDSTWLKTIVMTDGFKVRGHFRLQPIGEGRKKRKLIWVNDFEKSGYKREAGILRKENI